MPTCQFKNCDKPCLPIIDKESTVTVNSVSDSHDEIIKRKIHPTIGFEDYCYYHMKITQGKTCPSNLLKNDFKTGQQLRHKQNIFNEQFMKKKMQSL